MDKLVTPETPDGKPREVDFSDRFCFTSLPLKLEDEAFIFAYIAPGPNDMMLVRGVAYRWTGVELAMSRPPFIGRRPYPLSIYSEPGTSWDNPFTFETIEAAKKVLADHYTQLMKAPPKKILKPKSF